MLRTRVTAGLPAFLLAGLLLAGCSATTGSATASDTAPRSDTGAPPSPSATGQALPAPGRTIPATPTAPGDLQGFRLATVVPDASDTSQTLLAAARRFAADTGARLDEFPASPDDADPVGQALERAVATQPDLVVGLGEGVVSVFDIETAKILAQPVLIIGGQLAEPTENVTAVIWPGATSRDPEPDPASVTHRRGLDALIAGVASVRDGVEGVVLHLDPAH